MWKWRCAMRIAFSIARRGSTSARWDRERWPAQRLPLDRTIAARELGFTAPTANSIDATSDRDFILEYLNALTFVGLHLSRFAEEITLFATAEFGFVTLPEAFSTGSSAMPQKKNPDLTELIRAKVGRIHGAAHGGRDAAQRAAFGLQ